MSKELEQQLTAEKTAREAVERELTEIKTAQAKAEKAAAEKANADFAEGLLKEGKLLPKNKEKVIALLNAQPVTADFSEGKSQLDELKALLEESPVLLEFSEKAKNGTAGDGESADYAEGTDPAAIELDKNIQNYMKEHKVDYSTAFARVAK